MAVGWSNRTCEDGVTGAEIGAIIRGEEDKETENQISVSGMRSNENKNKEVKQ